MASETIANMLHKKAIDLADKWADAYSRTTVDGRLMVDDVFSFVVHLIDTIEGYEGERKDIYEQLNEVDAEVNSVKQERDDLIGQLSHGGLPLFEHRLPACAVAYQGVAAEGAERRSFRSWYDSARGQGARRSSSVRRCAAGRTAFGGRRRIRSGDDDR